MSDNIQEKIEDKIIDCINSGVAGRLIIFKPEKNSFGADLAVERKGKYKEKEIYFKINSLVGPTKEDNFIKDFPKKNFKADKNFYLLFVYFDEIMQKLGDHVWLVPSAEFRDTAKVVSGEYPGENLLRFETPLDIKKSNGYSKFIVQADGLGKLIFNALEKGGKFKFQSHATEKIVINLDAMKEFLNEARKNTYASDAPPIDNPRLASSKQFEFQKSDYFYRDVFFSGDSKFIGQEIIYQDAKPVWGMNYIVETQGEPLNKLEENFLKEALFRLVGKCRFGQPCEYEKREFKYQDNGQGNLEKFSGQEQIFLEGKSIYRLDYQGGLL